ncbi:MAG: D-2-hydroxyacid dehydrogenase [bacterium]
MAESAEKINLLVTVPLPEEMLADIRAVSSRIRLTPFFTRKAEEVPADIWKKTEVLYTDAVLPDPQLAPELKFIQFHWTGLDLLVESPLFKNPEVQVAHSSGVAVSQIGEYAVMMMLALGHRLPEMTALQAKSEWVRNRWEKLIPVELRGSTVGIVGYGSIGREIARLLQPFGVKVLATKRNMMQPKDSGYTQEGLGDPEGALFHRLYPVQAIGSMLKECDFVVVCLPLTPSTHHLINDEVLRHMKPEAYLIDIGRGEIVDQAALLTALQEHRIAGAALDVFEEEPLNPQSPFWHLPNVYVTPHVSGVSTEYRRRAVELFIQNLTSYINGLPLQNVFNSEQGY